MSKMLSVTATARREQIVAAAIEVIARDGLAAASFGRIARTAGLSSTGLISYHFADRDELLRSVAASVAAGLADQVTDAMRATDSPRSALQAYVRTVLEHAAAHRPEMQALVALLSSDAFRALAEQDSSAQSALGAVLAAGHRTGEFRDFDPAIVADLVQRLVDGLVMTIAVRPDLDVAGYVDHAVDFVDRAVQVPS